MLAASCLGAFLAVSVRAPAETLDRVIASVDYQAITERDVEIEFRFEQFLSGKQPAGKPDAQERKIILDRLVEQTILAQEIPNSTLPSVPEEAVMADLKEVQKKFSSADAYRTALEAVGLSQDQVLDRIRRQKTILELIDKRLRPQAWVESSEVEKYYNETFVPAFKQHNTEEPPALSEVEGKIREILMQQKINKLLEQWINDLKTSHRVEIRSN